MRWGKTFCALVKERYMLSSLSYCKILCFYSTSFFLPTLNHTLFQNAVASRKKAGSFQSLLGLPKGPAWCGMVWESNNSYSEGCAKLHRQWWWLAQVLCSEATHSNYSSTQRNTQKHDILKCNSIQILQRPPQPATGLVLILLLWLLRDVCVVNSLRLLFHISGPENCQCHFT